MKLFQLMLLLGDVAMLYTALAMTLLLRHRTVPFPDYWAHHVVPFTLIFVLWTVVLFVYDLYNKQYVRITGGFLSRLIQASVLNGMLAVTFFYFTGVFVITPKTNLLLFAVFFFFLFLAWRSFAGHLMLNFIKQPSIRYLGLTTGTTNDVASPDLVVYGDVRSEEDQRVLYQSLVNGTPIRSIATYWEREHQEIPIELASRDWFLYEFGTQDRREFDLLKRVFDLTLAAILSIILFPVIVLCVTLVAVSSRGPVFYRQTRVGKFGKPFKLVKFRSMVVDAEKHGPQWSTKNDPRVTRIGKILRHTHLDELPQLLNVLKGDMSFVGPRPERPEMIQTLEAAMPFYALRHLVKPGVTGWAQINYQYGASVEDTKKKLSLDLYYVKHRSLFYDIRIILLTARMLFKGEGRL